MVTATRPFFHTGPLDGQALEATEDLIDEVNVIKGKKLTSAKHSPPEASETATPFGQESRFDADKDKSLFRRYTEACERVKSFYAEQHQKQTVAFNLAAREKFAIDTSPTPSVAPRDEMTVWEAMEKLDTLVDASDPDTDLSQIQHLLQTAEAMRRDGKPRWMQVTGLVHDLGKLLYFYGAEGQWDVVGDTFPVGCAFDHRIVLPETFAANPDASHPVYSTRFGMYEPGCGIENLVMSWGHDEYMYQVCVRQSRLPREALAMIRYHSFYAWHREGAYREFMRDGDEELLAAVRAFNPYDLYSKSDEAPTVEELKPYYLELIDEFFPQKVLRW
ncbi:hypothetical protein ACRALDRAFT_1045827 [Sodiomyces alcalophilus JCM 7366]|uniref:uncharacterized protein n=1 Tax=Sodiomyces alcalophilus JCM 7366 TaxID=591952 RepID=UPI0039B61A87